VNILKQLRKAYKDKEIPLEEYDNTLNTLAEEIYKEQEELAGIKNANLAEEVYAIISSAVSTNLADLGDVIPSWLVSVDFNRGSITLTSRLIYFPALKKYCKDFYTCIELEGNVSYTFTEPSVILIFDNNCIYIEIYKGQNDFNYLMKTLKRLQNKLNLKLDLGEIQDESIALTQKLDNLQQLIATFYSEKDKP
jgi:hypothetical protein